jgi:hypothetical protein
MPKVDLMDRQAPEAAPDLKAADILIAIPTFNCERTIASALALAQTVAMRFPGFRTVIAQVDGGSTDSTVERVRDIAREDSLVLQMSYPLYPVHQLQVTHYPIPGMESAYHTIFTKAEELDVTACCIMAPDSGTLAPDSIAALLQPVVEAGFDLVTPVYPRARHEGLLVGGILYPAVRALYGRCVRQPVAEESAYSRALIRQCLASKKGWNTDSARQDINLWVSLQTAQSDLKLCQVHLGTRPRADEGVMDVSSLLISLVGALYSEIERTAEVWQRVRGSSRLPTSGPACHASPDEPAPDVTPAIQTFRLAYQNLQDIWGMILPPGTLLELKRLSRQTGSDFRFTNSLWARTVYDFALAYRLRTIGRDHLLGALAPLYLGWVASFILRIREMDSIQVEDEIEQLCMAYESQKPYLISRWRWPDRFMP